MDLEGLNTNIERSQLYQFMQRHKRVINIIQGFFIILLLISIDTYVVKDHFIKKQIKENCGYTTGKIKCVCEKNYVDNWEEIQKQTIDLNLTNINKNVSVDR